MIMITFHSLQHQKYLQTQISSEPQNFSSLLAYGQEISDRRLEKNPTYN